MKSFLKTISYVISALVTLCALHPLAAPLEPVWSLAQKEKPALMETLKELTSIESGSSDLEGLEQIGAVLAKRFTQLGAKVEFFDGNLDATRDSASHSGSAPHLGINAVDELAHQILQNRDLSDPTIGLRANWVLANGGLVRNMIPPGAQATMNIRVLRVGELDGIEAKLRERIKNKLLPQAVVELNFERGRPPLEARTVSRALALHGQKIYSEIGKKMNVPDAPRGGGTDAAYAGLKTKAPVVEGFGLQGFGGHTTNAEFIVISSIEPRLYLAARMIMDISSGKAPLASP